MSLLIPIHETLKNHSKTPKGRSSDSFGRELDIDILARTLWGEARGEGSIGMQAVAAVIMNRMDIAKNNSSYWWGHTIVEICQKPYQFSCWNPEDPNLRKLLRVDSEDLYFATAKRIARRAIMGMLDDPTSGATHYHTVGVSPPWSKDKKPVAEIGSHFFFKLA